MLHHVVIERREVRERGGGGRERERERERRKWRERKGENRWSQSDGGE